MTTILSPGKLMLACACVLGPIAMTTPDAQAQTVSAVHNSTAPSAAYYGPGINMQSLNNIQVGSSLGQEVDYRFTALRSGTITTLRQYFIGPVAKPGYGSGNGATVQIQIETDDATGSHQPSGNSIGGLGSYDVCTNNGQSCPSFPLLTLDQPATVSAGKIYHIVYTNIARDPVNNWSSLDAIYMQQSLSPVQPTFTKLQLGVLFRDAAAGPWTEYNSPGTPDSGTPIVDIGYSDGSDQGVGYNQSLDNAEPIGGTSQVEEQFTVAGSNRTVARVAVYALRSSGKGQLVVRLEDNFRQSLGQVNLPASSFPQGSYAWGSAAFAVPIALTVGQTYHLVLSSRSAGYQAYPLGNAKVAGYGFGSGSVFDAVGNEARYTTNAGQTWVPWCTASNPCGPGNTPDTDLQFYFTLR